MDYLTNEYVYSSECWPLKIYGIILESFIYQSYEDLNRIKERRSASFFSPLKMDFSNSKVAMELCLSYEISDGDKSLSASIVTEIWDIELTIPSKLTIQNLNIEIEKSKKEAFDRPDLFLINFSSASRLEINNSSFKYPADYSFVRISPITTKWDAFIERSSIEAFSSARSSVLINVQKPKALNSGGALCIISSKLIIYTNI